MNGSETEIKAAQLPPTPTPPQAQPQPNLSVRSDATSQRPLLMVWVSYLRFEDIIAQTVDASQLDKN